MRGYPADSSGPGYRTERRMIGGLGDYSSGGAEFLLALRRLSPPSRKISEFSTSRSAIVAMVVLKRMLPQSEKGVLVVMMVDRF